MRVDGDAKLGTTARDNVLVAVVRGTPTLPAVLAMRSRAAELALAHPEGIGFLHVIEVSRGGPPDRLTRAAYVDMIRERTELRAVAIVGEGPPFLGALIRSVVTGFVMLTRPRYPFRTFGDLDEGATWLAAVLAYRGDDLARAVAELKKVLPA